ncbi:MAG TPA: hypothetical protein ENK26_02870 [Gammaproteobacteria bacterium]|nr:hypothetical protein [Gammaproteobacteria bacterium]
MRGLTLSSDAQTGWQRFSELLGFALVVGGVVCAVLAALWMTGDFVQSAVQSPNLNTETQVADFNDFRYLGQSLRQGRFGPGSLLLLIAIVATIQGTLLATREGSARTLFLAGGAALAVEVGFLLSGFHWPVFIIFLLSAAGLYLATEWRGIQRVARIDDEGADASVFDQFERDNDARFDERLPEPAFDPSVAGLTLEREPTITPVDEFVDPVPTRVDEVRPVEPVTDAFESEAAFLTGEAPPEKSAAVFSEERPAFSTEASTGEKSPRKSPLWNWFDWIVSALILLFGIAIALVLIAR